MQRPAFGGWLLVIGYAWKMRAVAKLVSLQGLKPQGFMAVGRRHKCLLHPVIDREFFAKG